MSGWSFFQIHGQPVENSYLAASQHGNIFTWAAVCGPACLDSLSHLGRNHLCRFSVAVPGESDHEQINRWTDVLEHLQYAQLHCGIRHPSQNLGFKSVCGSICDGWCLEEAPISTRASKSYQSAKIKEFGIILSNPDRFCNQKEQCMAWISDLDVSPLLEKNNTE